MTNKIEIKCYLKNLFWLHIFPFHLFSQTLTFKYLVEIIIKQKNKQTHKNEIC